MKFAIAATLAAAVSAKATDFPKFDSFHANCGMDVTFKGVSCGAIWTSIDATVRGWSNGGPSSGLYAVFEESKSSYVWSTRTTPVAHYVDDQIFELTPTTAGCAVSSRSRSQSLSQYDYSTNYCNMWNVFEAVGGYSNLSINHCQYHPSDPVATCAVY